MFAIGPRTMASDARRLKALEDENSTLKKLLAEAMLKDVAAKKWERPVSGGKRWPTSLRHTG